ncbi:hypothetical protein PZA11_007843 [Diplocarpon coronariae]
MLGAPVEISGKVRKVSPTTPKRPQGWNVVTEAMAENQRGFEVAWVSAGDEKLWFVTRLFALCRRSRHEEPGGLIRSG